MRFLVSLGMAGVLLLSGCSSAIPEPTRAPTPSTSVAPTPPTPTPTPEPSAPAPSPTPERYLIGVDLDDPSTWDIGFHGIGPVSLGASFEERSGDLRYYPLQEHLHDYCESIGAPDVWFTWFIRPGYPRLSISREGDGDSIREVAINKRESHRFDPTPRTREGIGLGSTYAELRATYPDLVKVEDLPAYYKLTNDAGVTIFFVLDGSDADRVSWITVTRASAPGFQVC